MDFQLHGAAGGTSYETGIKRAGHLDRTMSAIARVQESLHNWFHASKLWEGVLSLADGDAPPWRSKGTLNRIGEKLRAGEQLATEDAHALDSWRASHFHVMNSFQAMLRARAKKIPGVKVAQRHKRRLTIIDKLAREPKMQLARMDDVAGIRLIFPDAPKLFAFRDQFLKSTHGHDMKNAGDKYDYIASPRSTGYRGIHDVYAYSGGKHKHCAGSMIEVQYRTLQQHAWSTANEVVTMTLGQRTKFDDADSSFIEFFRLASEMLARTFDKRTSVYPEVANRELLERFNQVDQKLWLLGRLRGLNVAREHLGEFKSGVVLRFTIDKHLYIEPVPRFQEAMKFYFNVEKMFPDDDVVLVSGSSATDIRSAYQNYFSDTQDFLTCIDAAKVFLSSRPSS